MSSLRYEPVDTNDPSGGKIHVAIARTWNGRTSVQPFTVCDRQGKRVVTRLRHTPLDEVTCRPCRDQLVQDGEVAEISLD